MNRRIIEELIPIAIKEIEKLKQNTEKENEFFEIKILDGKQNCKIYKEFKGYISSFGASIVQSGLLSTVVFYESVDTNSIRNRRILTKLILNVIVEYKKNDELNKYEKLQNYILDFKDTKINSIKEEIVNAAIAIKLAIRVFEFTDNDESQVNS